MSTPSQGPSLEELIAYNVYHLQQGRSPYELPSMAERRWPGIAQELLNDAGIQAAERVSHLPITSALPGEQLSTLAPWTAGKANVEVTSTITILNAAGEVFDFPLRGIIIPPDATAQDLKEEIDKRLSEAAAEPSAGNNTKGGAYSISTLIEYVS